MRKNSNQATHLLPQHPANEPDAGYPDEPGQPSPSVRITANAKFILAGLFFGILLVKSEVMSWFRIQEMFRLQSFHMYGVMGSAVATGILSLWAIKKFNIKTWNGRPIRLPKKEFSKGQVYGGLLFGVGWCMTGACPGPLFAQIGSGATVILITLISALAGTWVYGYLQQKIPH